MKAAQQERMMYASTRADSYAHEIALARQSIPLTRH